MAGSNADTPSDQEPKNMNGYGSSFSFPDSTSSRIVHSRASILTLLRQSINSITTRPTLYSRTIDSGIAPSVTPLAQRYEEGPSNAAAEPSLPSIDASPSTPSISDRDMKPSIGSSELQLPSVSQHRDASGIDWATGEVGIRLWLNAHRQVGSQIRTPALLRSMHIDALRYMSMALPTDLSTNEVESIRIGLPPHVTLIGETSRLLGSGTRSNMLRRSIAQIVRWIVALIVIIIPLWITVLDRLLACEREYRVSRRMLHGSTNLTRRLGEHSLQLGDVFVRSINTPVGKRTIGILAWIINGVVGGLNDGLAQSIGRPGEQSQELS